MGPHQSWMNISGLRADLSEGQLAPARHATIGPCPPQHFGEWGGALPPEFAKKGGSVGDQVSASQPDFPDRTTGRTARAVFSCRTRPRRPIGELGHHRPFGENYGGGGGGSRGDRNRRRRRRHPRQKRIRPRPAGHSCFCHSPARSSAFSRTRKSRNNNGTLSDSPPVK